MNQCTKRVFDWLGNDSTQFRFASADYSTRQKLEIQAVKGQNLDVTGSQISDAN